MNILTLLIFIPVLFALLIWAMPSAWRGSFKFLALAATLIQLGLAVWIYFHFKTGAGFGGISQESQYQFVQKRPWINLSLGAGTKMQIDYFVGIDGISLAMLVMTSLVMVIAALSAWEIKSNLKGFFILFLILDMAVIGVFCSLDFFLFYLFYELMLLPLYFLIGMWGGVRREYAAIKFFLYTLAGSVLMLLGILTLYFQHFHQFGFYTFEIAELMKISLPMGLQQWVFWAFFVGFAIKVPMFPFHTWLPDAHVEAPTAGSVILAAVLLKMGTYGFLRFSLPLLPQASADRTIVQILAALSIVGIIYGALVSLMQADWKKLIAYSSVSHLGFCTLGIFSVTPNGIAGSVLQQINHGISTGMLFMVIGVIYERRHTREIGEYGGLAHVMPKFAVIFAIAMLSSAGLPLLNGFVGEFTILQGAFEANRIWAAFAVTGVILGAAYLLWLYQRTMLGQVTNGKNLTIPDMNFREVAMFVPLIAWAVWIGVYPKPYFDILRRPVAEIVERVRPGYFSGAVQNAVLPPSGQAGNLPYVAEAAR